MVSAETASGRHACSRSKGTHDTRPPPAFGTAVTSGTFSVGGHSWRIQYFPCGYTGKENAGWLCFGLHLVVLPEPAAAADGGIVKATFSLSLLDKDGAPLPSPYRRRVSSLLDFSSTHNEWQFKQFIRSKDLDSLCLKADCFRIRCDVTVVLETRDKSSVLASGVGGDVTFEVGKETFVAHKNVLAARSPVFMAELFRSMMEEKAAAARVRILRIHARAFKAMLHFIYTDLLPEIDEDDKIPMVQHLLVAADRYDIQRMKLIGENKLCISVNASVAVTTLVLAVAVASRRRALIC
ncbi:unnamed protein product [Miscanthus lutarioriparius]|uniref:Uncharacterized protein n=1 Tax=Miscanthus lutarioriparius TaxID=422564 RepID=A0A811QH24_9POAL|nr:unnamed protein product [Miscanthus lutarioriparius]